MTRRKIEWKVGDLFLVPTSDSKFCLGQIIGQERQALNSVSVVLFDIRFEKLIDAEEYKAPLRHSDIYSSVFVTRDLLDSGGWTICGHSEVKLPSEFLPYENLRSSGFVGGKIIGSGIINSFVNAYYGLEYWDKWHDPAYLDKMLFPGKSRPKNIKLKHLDQQDNPRSTTP